MIYLVKEVGTSLYKIGYTAGEPGKRLAGLQTGNSRKLRLIDTWAGDRAVEKWLHECIENEGSDMCLRKREWLWENWGEADARSDDIRIERVRGEWFRLDGLIAGWFVDSMLHGYPHPDQNTDSSTPALVYVDLIGTGIPPSKVREVSLDGALRRAKVKILNDLAKEDESQLRASFAGRTMQFLIELWFDEAALPAACRYVRAEIIDDEVIFHTKEFDQRAFKRFDASLVTMEVVA